MTWLTWRQFRAQAAAAFAALVALAAALALTGPGIADTFATGTAACAASGDCSMFLRAFVADHQSVYLGLVTLTMAVPAVIGLFWGAPLIARELETGTHRLVWNQSVTRTRWLAVKLGLTALVAMAITGLLSLAVTWWSSTIDQTGINDYTRLSAVLFASRDIAPIGYAAFAFALGVTVGMLVRRTLPAMALTLVVFVAIQIAMPTLVRPHVLAPTDVTVAITAENLVGLRIASTQGPVEELAISINDPGAWILVNETIDSTGNPVNSLPMWVEACISPPAQRVDSVSPDRQACLARLADEGYRQKVVYHADSRYWTFQWIETTIFFVATGLLAGFCFWWVRRRVS